MSLTKINFRMNSMSIVCLRSLGQFNIVSYLINVSRLVGHIVLKNTSTIHIFKEHTFYRKTNERPIVRNYYVGLFILTKNQPIGSSGCSHEPIISSNRKP